MPVKSISANKIEIVREFLTNVRNIHKYDDNQCNCVECRHARRAGAFSHDKLCSLMDTVYGSRLPALHSRKFRNVDYARRVSYIKFRLISILEIGSIEGHCHICGAIHTDNKVINGKYVCPECVSEYYEKCPVCHEFHIREGMPVVNLNTFPVFVCNKCLNSQLLCKCSKCGRYEHKNKAGTWVKVNKYGHLEEDPNGVELLTVCGECAAEYGGATCSQCGKKIVCGMDRHDDIPDDICRKCCIQYKSVHHYKYKPPFDVFLAKNEAIKDKDTLLFGVELEFENVARKSARSTASKAIRNTWRSGLVYCVHDGSLASKDAGLEAVTMPFSLRHFTTNQNTWYTFFDVVKSTGFEGDGQPKAGCHIHISKEPFHTLHLYKFTRFIFNENNRDFINFISNRCDTMNNEYWSFKPERFGSEKRLAKDRKNLNANKLHTNRRTAVNLTDDTVELRIFQSTTDLSTLNSYIEFCVSLFNFTRDTSLKKCNYANYCKYVLSHASTYSHLCNNLTSKGAAFCV